MKVVKNICYGGFDLSDKALFRLSEITGKTFKECDRDYNYGDNASRAAPELAQVVEELGEDANGYCADLVVVEIPDDVGWNWFINDYDGLETIEENHRSW